MMLYEERELARLQREPPDMRVTVLIIAVIALAVALWG